MKYTAPKMPLDTTLSASVQSWLGHELESRGIDAVVYTRYILSILQKDSFDVEITEDFFPPAKKGLCGPNSTGRGGKGKGKKAEKRKSADINCDEFKKSAAIECLLSVSDEKSGIETLVDELCLKLQEQHNTEAQPIPDVTDHNESSDSIISTSPEDPAERYYAAFPALSDKCEKLKPKTYVPEESMWAKVAQKSLSAQRSDSEDSHGHARSDCEDVGNEENRIDIKKVKQIESKHTGKTYEDSTTRRSNLDRPGRRNRGGRSPGRNSRTEKKPSGYGGRKKSSPRERNHGTKGKSVEQIKGKYLSREMSEPLQTNHKPGDLSKRFRSESDLENCPSFQIPLMVNRQKKAHYYEAIPEPETYAYTKKYPVRIESAFTKEDLDIKAERVIAAMRRARMGRAGSENNSGDEEVQRVVGLSKENLLWYTGPIETLLANSPLPRERLYCRIGDVSEENEQEEADNTTPLIGSQGAEDIGGLDQTPKAETLLHITTSVGEEMIDEFGVTSTQEENADQLEACWISEAEADLTDEQTLNDRCPLLDNARVPVSEEEETFVKPETPDAVSPEYDNANNIRREMIIMLSPDFNAKLDQSNNNISIAYQKGDPITDESARKNANSPSIWNSNKKDLADVKVDESSVAQELVELLVPPSDHLKIPMFTSELQLHDTGCQEMSIADVQELFSQLEKVGSEENIPPAKKQTLLNAIVFGKIGEQQSIGDMNKSQDLNANNQLPKYEAGDHSSNELMRIDYICDPDTCGGVFDMPELDFTDAVQKDQSCDTDDDFDSAIDIVSGIRSIVQSPSCDLVTGIRSITQSPSINLDLVEPHSTCECGIDSPLQQPSGLFSESAFMRHSGNLYSPLDGFSEQKGIPLPENTENKVLDDRPQFYVDLGNNSCTSRDTSQTDLSLCSNSEVTEMLEQLWTDETDTGPWGDNNKEKNDFPCVPMKPANSPEIDWKNCDDELAKISQCQCPTLAREGSSSWTFVGDIHFGKYGKYFFNQGELCREESFSCDNINSVNNRSVEQGNFSVRQATYPCTLSSLNSGNIKPGIWSSVFSPVYELSPLWTSPWGLAFTSCSVANAFGSEPYYENTHHLPSCFSPMKGMSETSHIWDINVLKRYEMESLFSPWDNGSPTANVEKYLWNLCFDRPANDPQNIYIEGGLYGNSWDLSGAFKSLDKPALVNPKEDYYDEAFEEGTDDMLGNNNKPLSFRQRSTSADTADILDLIYGVRRPSSKHSHSEGILPSENSAFSGTVPRRLPQLPHVKSEPNISPRSGHCRMDGLRLVQIKHLYKPDTSILRHLGLSCEDDEKQDGEFEYSPDRHFRPIQTPQNTPVSDIEIGGLPEDTNKEDILSQHSCSTRSSGYLFYQGEEASEKAFIPRFKLRQDLEKYAQTGESVDDDDDKQNSLTERLLKDMKSVLKIEEMFDGTDCPCDDRITMQDLDKSLEMPTIEDNDIEDSGDADNSVSCGVDIARLWEDNEVSTASTQASTSEAVATTENDSESCSNGFKSIWSYGIKPDLPSVPAPFLVRRSPCPPEVSAENNVETTSVIEADDTKNKVASVLPDSASDSEVEDLPADAVSKETLHRASDDLQPVVTGQDTDQIESREVEDEVYVEDGFEFDSLMFSGLDKAVPSNQAVYSTDLEEQWLSSQEPFSVQVPKSKYTYQGKRSHSRKPCSFFMEGHCRRSDCKFAHDVSQITCRFWEEGECFKGITCPFLHGYHSDSPFEEFDSKNDSDFFLEEEDFPELGKSEGENSKLDPSSAATSEESLDLISDPPKAIYINHRRLQEHFRSKPIDISCRNK